MGYKAEIDGLATVSFTVSQKNGLTALKYTSFYDHSKIVAVLYFFNVQVKKRKRKICTTASLATILRNKYGMAIQALLQSF